MAQPFAQRALTLLATACPEKTAEELARLSIGERDGRLLTLREWTFGPRLEGLATCPGCSKRLEFTLNIGEIRFIPEVKQPENLSLTIGEYVVHFRLPNSLDLAAISGQEDETVSRSLVLNRCLFSIQRGNEKESMERLPSGVVQAVLDKMAETDPQADVQLDLSCPWCRHQWQIPFDIVSFFWNEMDAWARRILREVHILASAYGWREADILAMSPWRRQIYLEMVGA